MSRRIVSSAIFVLLLAIAPSAFPQDAHRILRRTSQIYAGLKSYHFEGTSQLTLEVDGVKYRMNVPVEIAQGSTSEMYLTLLNKAPVWEKPIASAPQYYPPMPRVVVYNFAVLGQRVKSAKLLRVGTLEANGTNRDCYVIEVSNVTAASPKTVWIDKITRLVLRMEFQTVATVKESLPKLEHNWVTTFTSYKLNADPPDWLIKTKTARKEADTALSQRKIGTQAPDFKLKGLDGQEVTLANLRGKVVLLAFWATWCLPCRDELPLLARTERKWSAKGLSVVRITNEAPEDVQTFLKRGIIYLTNQTPEVYGV